MHTETVWQFNTARFRVALEIAPEDMDPADSFQFQDDIDAVRNGDVEWFAASVAVYLDGREVARDWLGGCAYRTIREFYTSHRVHRQGDYFTDMVASAVSEARRVLRAMPELRA